MMRTSIPKRILSRGRRPKRAAAGCKNVHVQNPICRQSLSRNLPQKHPQSKPRSLSLNSYVISTPPSLINSLSTSGFSLRPPAAQSHQFSPLSSRNFLFKFPPARKTSLLSTSSVASCWRWPPSMGCCWVSSTSSSKKSPSPGSTDSGCSASDWSCFRTRSGSTRWMDQTDPSNWFRSSSRMATTRGACLPPSSPRPVSSLPCSELACSGL